MLDEHFAFYSVFGCPGLRKTPQILLCTLLLNLLYALLLPITLFFTPMILMIKNYQGNLLISDQAHRLQDKTTKYFHINFARLIVLIGFSLLGAICGAFLGAIGGSIGIFYQLVKVASIFFKVAFRCEARLERRHQSSTAPHVPSSLDSAGLFSDTSAISDEPSIISMRKIGAGPRRTLCCLRLPNTCPVCKTCAYKFDSNNDMSCLVCGANWCWTCRKRIDESKLGDLHFEWYNVFGCPGLKHTPNHFLTGLAAKLLVSLLFPLTLLFAPLVVSMANYKPGSSLVKDQAVRFKQ